MATDKVWLDIEQITRMIQPYGWKVITTDTSGSVIKLIIQKDKEKPK